MADTAVNQTGQASVAGPRTASPPGSAPGTAALPPAAPGTGPGPESGIPAGTAAAAGARPSPGRPGGPQPALRITGIALLLLAVFLLGFAGYLYGLSGVQEARSQTVMFTDLRNLLAGQLAPLGSKSGSKLLAPGTPMALLDIPAIGIQNMVVVEGTTPQNLTLGPGHRRDSPFPGQPGVSQIYGRRATYGAPFARIGSLRPGDTIRVATGEGFSTYVVAAIAESTQVIQDPVANRLLLLTASSPVLPGHYLTVDARLTSSVRGNPGTSPLINTSELPLATDGSALALTSAMEWALLLALACSGATAAALRWSPWATYIAAAPVILAVLWNLYQSLAALLPNVY